AVANPPALLGFPLQTGTTIANSRAFRLVRRDACHDGVVPRLDRRTARPRAAEMVFGRAPGATRPAGCHRPLRLDRSGSQTVARPACEAAPGAAQMIPQVQPSILSC